MEQRARGFAPAFLAPRGQVSEWVAATDLPQDPTGLVTRMAEHWGLSFEGAIWHSKNCRLISSDVADRLDQEHVQPHLPADRFESAPISFRPSMVHADLPENAAPLIDGWAARLIVDALESATISLGRARELLLWS